MVSDHKEDVAAFRRESSNGQDADVKEFATQTLPTLEDHLKEAQTITPKLQRSADNASRPDAPRPN
jgi:putative membrane protein